jgi:hypothetical protein
MVVEGYDREGCFTLWQPGSKKRKQGARDEIFKVTSLTLSWIHFLL